MKQHSDGRRMLWTPNTERLFALLTGDEHPRVAGRLAWCSGDPLNKVPAHAAPRGDFGSHRGRLHGISQRCRRCNRTYMRTWRKNRKERQQHELTKKLAEIQQREQRW